MKNPSLFLLLLIPLTFGCSKSSNDSASPPPGRTHAATPVENPPPGAVPAAKPRDAGSPSNPAGGADAKSAEACIDKYLAEHHLNEYGDPEGTTYAGGTPLFDEATGKTTPRLDYVFSKQPDAKKACAAAP